MGSLPPEPSNLFTELFPHTQRNQRVVLRKVSCVAPVLQEGAASSPVAPNHFFYKLTITLGTLYTRTSVAKPSSYRRNHVSAPVLQEGTAGRFRDG